MQLRWTGHVLSAMSATLQLNQGRCAVVGPAGFEKPMCNCTRDLLKSFKTLTQDNNDIGMEGTIEIMDSPMVSDMSFTKSFAGYSRRRRRRRLFRRLRVRL